MAAAGGSAPSELHVLGIVGVGDGFGVKVGVSW